MNSRYRLSLWTIVCVSVLAFSCKAQSPTPPQDIRQVYGIAVSGEVTPDAVQRIAALPIPEATELLSSLVITPTASFENRLGALDELNRLATPDAFEGIAKILAPHTPMDLREHAAELLARSNQCSNRCIYSVLFYLYRSAAGEMAAREKDAKHHVEIEQRKNGIVAELDRLLARERKAAIGSLIAFYGLGTDEPSEFSLSLLRRLRVTESCPYLVKSAELQSRLAKIRPSNPASTLKLIKDLGCEHARD
jgi:hypothetical protein